MSNTTPDVQSLGALLARAARRWPTAEIVFPEERANYTELDQRATDMAVLVRAAGAQPGDKVAVMLPPCIDLAAAILGVSRAGCVVVPMSERWKETEIRHVLRQADVRVLLTTDFAVASLDLVKAISGALPTLADAPSGLDAVRPAPTEAPELERIVLLGHQSGSAPAGFTSAADIAQPHALAERSAEATADDELGPEDFAYIMFTSGTSSAPKGCLITHGGVLEQAKALAETRYRLTAGDVFWCPIALHHNGGLTSFTQCLTAGASFVHAGFFSADVSLRQLVDERCTHAQFGMETIWRPIVEHPGFADGDLSALRVTFTAGSESRLRHFQAAVPHTVVLTNYGLTEGTGHFAMVLPTDTLDIRMTTGGVPLPGNELKIVNPETGDECEPGVNGEILIRGSLVFKGYYNDPENTAKVFDADHWYHTGDRGHVDSEGRVTFVDRLKDTLRVGGENVSSSDVEGYLLSHPAVKAAAVVAAPDEKYEQVPAAFIETQPGAILTEQELIDYCLGSIATYKVPRYVRFVQEWPMSSTKIRKPVLREAIEKELAERGIRSAPKLTPASSA